MKQNDKNGRLQKVLGIIAMMCLIMALLLTSFQIAIYGDSDYKFYEKEYAKYQVTESLDMEREELSVITTVEGKEQDFFNEQDRLHMADVKNLFLGGLKLRWLLLGVSLILVGVLFIRKADVKQILPDAYFKALAIFGTLTIVLGGLFASDFNRYFVIFHKIFFTNDLWIFDPATDYMIRMLPEGFFYDMVMRIGMVFIAGLLLIAGGMFLIKRRNIDQQK